jgi:hypothetical protein
MGTLFHITIFTLVVQSTTVVGMILNFAALEFITTVDDASADTLPTRSRLHVTK